MKIKPLTVGQMQENCFLLIDDETDTALIVDPGDDAEFIMQAIAEEEVTPVGIVATHGHFDHVMAAFELQITYDVPFYMHKDDQFLIDRMQETADYFMPGTQCPPPPQKIEYWDEGSVVIGPFEFVVLRTPGHTPGSVSLFFEDDQAVFCGDVMFAGGGFGRTDFKYCSALKLQDSIAGLLKLGDEVTVFSGHGPSTMIGNEKKFWDQEYVCAEVSEC